MAKESYKNYLTAVKACILSKKIIISSIYISKAIKFVDACLMNNDEFDLVWVNANFNKYIDGLEDHCPYACFKP